MLPVLGQIWLRLVQFALAYPQRLVMLASKDERIRLDVARDFHAKKSCCVPWGIRELHDGLTCVEDALDYQTQVLAQELAAQLDLSIFDRDDESRPSQTPL